MPHGSLRIGRFEVTALCDVVADFPRPFRRAFPDVPEERWPELRERYPDAFRGGEAWLLHDHCYLIRDDRRAVVVDTGVGPDWALGAQWIHSGGGLPDELAAAGVDRADIDIVVITHAHLDHIGWSVERDGDTARPWFPNARYVLQRAEWERFRELEDEVGQLAFEQSLTPLEGLGVLRLADGDERLGPGLAAVHTPGHTPGHQVVLLESDEGRAAFTGDLANHPAQAEEPGWRASGDLEPELAAAARAALLDRLEAEGALVCTAHWPWPFARLTRAGGRRTVSFGDTAAQG